ncbi:transmembrane ascorbate-dependent reductase CYB561 isoform X2 [Planococcus citri]|uniref:transmembrane ascorbate-dependent reductase CYB561 isoform X2 n=1 Tax=Planococcus citri TaxID=170843 RepID=UPI0031F8FD36
MKDNSSAKSKSAQITEVSSAKSKTKEDGKSKNNVAPIAEFDKSPPSTLEEVLTVGDLTPPTEAIDDLVSAQYSASQHDKSSKKSAKKNRQYDDDDEFTTCNWMEYVLVVVLSCSLLVAALILILFWTLYFQKGFAWHEEPEKQFNLHPTLMVTGFITISGFSMLLYRISRCCRHIFVKLFHTIFHILAIPCIGLGFFAVFDKKMLSGETHFYTLHSWMGLVTMGMFALQFVFGFFSFLVLLCCEGATAACRAAFVPIHASFGTTIFMLAVATSLTGLTQKTWKLFASDQIMLTDETLVVNILAMVLIASAIMAAYILSRIDFKYHDRILVHSEDDI